MGCIRTNWKNKMCLWCAFMITQTCFFRRQPEQTHKHTFLVIVFVINLLFDSNPPLLNIIPVYTLLKLLCPSVLSLPTRMKINVLFWWYNCVYSWRTSAGYICHLFLMRLCFIFSFLIIPGNESPRTVLFFLCRALVSVRQWDCEKMQETQIKKIREEKGRKKLPVRLGDRVRRTLFTVSSSAAGYNFGQSGKQCNQLIKHLRSKPDWVALLLWARHQSP